MRRARDSTGFAGATRSPAHRRQRSVQLRPSLCHSLEQFAKLRLCVPARIQLEYPSAAVSNGCDESIALQLLDGLCNAGHARP
jgi:hypothetical protein